RLTRGWDEPSYGGRDVRSRPFSFPTLPMFARTLRVFGRRAATAIILPALLAGCTLNETTAPIRRLDPIGLRDLNVNYRTPSKAAVPGLRTNTIAGSTRRFSVFVPTNYTP